MESKGKRKRPVIRIVIGLFAALIAVIAVTTAVDMRRARALAVDACSRAATGLLLDDLLPAFPEKDYRKIKGPDQIILVPKKGMGRFNCTISHDGHSVTGSRVDFID